MTDQQRQEQIRQIASATDDELRALRGQLFDPPADTDEDAEPPRTNRVPGEGSSTPAPPTEREALSAFASELFDR